MRRPLTGAAATITAAALLTLTACSSTGTTTPATPTGANTAASGVSGSTAPRGGGRTSSRPPVAPTAGPSAAFETITAPGAPFMGAASPAGLPASYVEEELIASGDASGYETPATLSLDGTWTFTPKGSAPYRTRVLVRRPKDASTFSGNVIVEWLNVSGGIDANPDYVSLSEEMLRNGDVWVGVSAQLIGVEGGPVLVAAPSGEGIAGKGLKGIDAARYGSLVHPGDGFSFDMYTQIARTLRSGGTALGGLQPSYVIAAGESQSAIALTTYYNGVQPLTKAFDGFLVHSRGGGVLPVVEPGKPADLTGSIGRNGFLFRTDLDQPVLDMQTEGDLVSVLASATARQPDTDRFRLWEVAGTAHADAHLVGALASSFDCGAPLNDGPMHVVAKAALRALTSWVRDGTPPPIAPRVEVTGGDTPTIQRDADGIALGGIRTPPVDVPAEVLSGTPGPSNAVICILFGSTLPLPAERLAALYPSVDEYEKRFEASADETIAAGFVLEEDRAALLAYARPEKVKG